MTAYRDEDRRLLERLVDAPTNRVDLSPLMYAAGAAPESLEVYVNGSLCMSAADYYGFPDYVDIAEKLLAGDTVRITGLAADDGEP